MQYIIQDLFKLSLEERLIIIEKLINSVNHSDVEIDFQNIIQKQVDLVK